MLQKANYRQFCFVRSPDDAKEARARASILGGWRTLRHWNFKGKLQYIWSIDSQEND